MAEAVVVLLLVAFPPPGSFSARSLAKDVVVAQSLPEAFNPGAVVRSPWNWGKGRACSLHLGDNVVLQTESQDHGLMCRP